MGAGRWSSSTYAANAALRSVNGTSAFAYSDTTMRAPRTEWRVHQTLDPNGIDVRESRDSTEHPNSTPIAVWFDVTGSMRQIPQTLQAKLPSLLEMLLDRGYVDDPQVLFGGVGDATCDAVPLQVGQFESDNRMDGDLGNLFLEGGGGGQTTESYELAFYLMARHTATDNFEKRGEKGYAFFIGDEMSYPKVKQSEVLRIMNDGLQADIPLDDIIEELHEKWNAYFIIPSRASHGGDKRIEEYWRKHFGENVVMIEDADAVCETIALIVGINEGSVSLDGGLDELSKIGADKATVEATKNALVGVAKDLGGS